MDIERIKRELQSIELACHKLRGLLAEADQQTDDTDDTDDAEIAAMIGYLQARSHKMAETSTRFINGLAAFYAERGHLSASQLASLKSTYERYEDQ